MSHENYTDCWYGSCYLQEFSEAYDKIHIPLATFICVFGAISNVVNIIVLTRIRTTPANAFLTGLSLAQFLLDTNYLGLLLCNLFRSLCFPISWGYMATTYRLVNVNLNVIFHTVAFTHTVALAIFRSCALRRPISVKGFMFSSDWAITTSILIYMIVPVVCIPVFFTSNVSLVSRSSTSCDLDILMYDLSYAKDTVLVRAVFWMFGVVMKLIPSLILMVLLISLIRSLQSVEHQRREGLGKRQFVIHESGGRRFMTTHALMAIVILCSLVEFPHGILNLLTAMNGEHFGEQIYDHLGSLFEMATLLYSSINFFFYVITSEDFRRTFRQLFLAKPKDPIRSIPRSSRSINNLPPPLTKTAESVALLENAQPSAPNSTIFIPGPLL